MFVSFVVKTKGLLPCDLQPGDLISTKAWICSEFQELANDPMACMWNQVVRRQLSVSYYFCTGSISFCCPSIRAGGSYGFV